MINDRFVSDCSESGEVLYPHLKITSEFFPRILATRRIDNEDAEYFGAFLTKTAVRILIDFLNRTFRLRSCDISIDGNFAVPCTQYYLKRCIAPCVASICSRENYLARVHLARLFLANERNELTNYLSRQITSSAEELNFEKAASLRDILLASEEYWQNPRLDVWLDDAVDTYQTDETLAGNFIYLVTLRNRHILGRKVFQLPKGGGLDAHQAIGHIISSFYRCHLPKEIRVSFDFEDRQKLASALSERFGRNVKINLVRPDRQQISAVRALKLARSETELDFVAARATPRQIRGEMQRLFDLDKLPDRAEAFDVAHISGTSFAAAWSVWENGKYLTEEYGFHLSNEKSELAVIADAVRRRLEQPDRPFPDIILLDGGRSQLKATLSAIGECKRNAIVIIGAVKPRGRHSSIAYFLNSSGEQIEYDSDNPAQNVLRLLRDAAHNLSNRIHRDLRDLSYHYDLAAVLPSIDESERRKLLAAAGSLRKISHLDNSILMKLIGNERADLAVSDLKRSHSPNTKPVVPLIVPIRFDDADGDAADLIPISYK